MGVFKDDYDFDHLRRVLLRETNEGPVPIIELVADPEIMSAVTGIEFPAERALEIYYLGPNPTMEQLQLGLQLMDLSLAFSEKVGYDYVTMIPVVPIPRTEFLRSHNPQQEGKAREWLDEHHGLIMDRASFESFPWPSVDSISMVAMDYAESKMPGGMKVIAVYTGIFEDLKRLMGFEQMALKSIDDPGLCGDILARLAELAKAAVDLCAAHPAVGAVFYAEDMGFNRSLMFSPAWMRKWLIPHLQEIAAACHQHGKPFLLHSCGQIDALMEDLIETVGIDARHSFQDNVEPVEEVYRKYRDRISILGGVDVDLLARGTPEQVRRRTREILDACAPGGGFCMGSGNSLPNFIQVKNYYAMLEETRKWNEEHGYA